MKYLIHYSLPNEIFGYVMGAKNEQTLATFINIEVEVQNNEQ